MEGVNTQHIEVGHDGTYSTGQVTYTNDGKQIGIGYLQNGGDGTPAPGSVHPIDGYPADVPGNALVTSSLQNNLGALTIDCQEPYIDTNT